MNNNNQSFEKQTSGSTPDASDERNRILEEHAKRYPEGDPSVRRKSPDKGTIGSRDKGAAGKKA
jgi:hypothetical protein